jgi:hypothetical protein
MLLREESRSLISGTLSMTSKTVFPMTLDLTIADKQGPKVMSTRSPVLKAMTMARTSPAV